jgi:hypothetical protein
MEAGWLGQCRVLIARAALLSLRETPARDAPLRRRAPIADDTARQVGCARFVCIVRDLRQVCRINEHQPRDLNEIELAYRLHD